MFRSTSYQSDLCLQHTTAGIALFSSTGAYVQSNERFRSMFETLDYSNLNQLQRAADGALGELSTTQFRLHVTGATQLRWLQCDISAVQTSDTCGYVLSAYDLTPQMESVHTLKQQNEKLMATSRMLSVGEMTTTIAHELNQPLATIVNCLRYLIKTTDSLDNRARDAVQLAQLQAEHAAAVVKHMREFVRAKEPVLRPCRVESFVTTVVQLIAPDIEREHVQLLIDIGDDTPDVQVDETMIQQVLLNLLRNAVEAFTDGHQPAADKKVNIVTGVNLQGQVELRVIDNAGGLAAGTDTDLFTPFHTTKPDGLGIGLSICRSIVEYHNGRLTYERVADGSAFVVSLPASASVASASDPARISTATATLNEAAYGE